MILSAKLKKITNRIKNAKGLTIIEVLIASAVFMIGFSIARESSRPMRGHIVLTQHSINGKFSN